MTPERMQQACELFELALQRPAGERTAFLVDACGSDADLRAEIDSLLEHDTRVTADFLRPPEPAAATRFAAWHDADARLGTRVGAFHIQRVIAAGGMGTVYEAVQDRPQRTVALKIMKGNLASRAALRRFEFEAQVLGRLRHPNIAQVYQAGMHDDGSGGVPYFAMEYIPGARSITRYADEEALSTHDRLRLFAKVCDAVHHGHQRGIIHRDLKPANILVDSGGEPKVIDFGVARATDADLSVTTQQTCVGQLVGTVQYMSPEQCDADPHDLDTRSDVYSLGVVLYELLTGELPYEATNTTLYAATRAIKEQVPRRPSSINRRLRGDVETIVLKALEKDRTQRYQSAGDLAQDIQRHLDREPIAARPPTAWTRAVHLVARNPAITTAVASVGIAALVVGATYATIWYLHRQPSMLNFYLEHETDWGESADAELLARSRNSLKRWPWQEGIRFARLLDRPDPLGGGKVVCLGFRATPQSPFPGCLCAFDAYGDFTKPIWQRRVETEEILPELRSFRKSTAAQFTVGQAWLLDVFPEDRFPQCVGEEIVVIFGRWMYSQCAIRIYNQRGDLLYQIWHDGVLNTCYFMREAGLLLWAGDCQWPYHDNYGNLLGQKVDDYVVFALRPEPGFIGDSYLDYLGGKNGDERLDPVWYRRLRPDFDPSRSPRTEAALTLYTADLPNDPRRTACCQVSPYEPWRGGVQWVINERGEELPGTRIVSDPYKRNQNLPDGHSDKVKVPPPDEFKLVSMTLADLPPNCPYALSVAEESKP